MLIRNLLAAGLALLAVGVQDASAAVIKCDGCSPGAYQALAQQRGTGDHLVYDLINNQAVRFEVHWDAEQRVWEVEPADVPPEIIAAVDKLALVHRLTGGSMREQIEVPARNIGIGGIRDASAYDVVFDRVLRREIEHWIAQNGVPTDGLSDAGRALVEAAATTAVAFFGLLEHPILRITVVFEDGSRVTYELNVGNGEVSYVSGSALSPEGQMLLEENGVEYQGTYRFNSDQSLERFLQQARQLQIPIVGGGRFYRCSWDGRTLTCTGF